MWKSYTGWPQPWDAVGRRALKDSTGLPWPTMANHGQMVFDPGQVGQGRSRAVKGLSWSAKEFAHPSSGSVLAGAADSQIREYSSFEVNT